MSTPPSSEGGDEFVEDVDPMTETSNEQEFVENYDSLTTDTPVATSKPTHEQKVQKGLGTLIVGAALTANLLVMTFYLGDFTDPSEGLKDLATLSMSGLQTLAAAVAGFYFASRK